MLVVAYICPDQDIAYLCEQTSLYLAYGITLLANKVNSFSFSQTSAEVSVVFQSLLSINQFVIDSAAA